MFGFRKRSFNFKSLHIHMFVECSFYEQNTVSPQELQLRFQEYLEHEAKYFLNPVKYFLHCISTRYNETVF